MAHHKSAIKKIRRDERRRAINKIRKTKLKNVLKKFEEAFETKDREKIEKALKDCYKALDRAVSWGIIHDNKAARKKSRLTKKVLALFPPEKSKPQLSESKE